jgi:hypothetical protein
MNDVCILTEAEFEMMGGLEWFTLIEKPDAKFKPRFPRFLKCQTNDSAYEPPNGFDANRILGIALDYIDKGWSPLPIPYREKAPRIKDWHNLKIDRTNASQHFNGAPQNIGVLLGPMSNGLVDGDLDCREALATASYLMPMTKAIFGRK